MKPMIKELLDAVKASVQEALTKLSNSIGVRFKGVEDTLSSVASENARLKEELETGRLAFEAHVISALSLEKLTEKVTNAFKERDELTVRACTEVVRTLAQSFESKLAETKEEFARTITGVEKLVKELPTLPEIPTVPTLQEIANAAAELVPIPTVRDGVDGVSPTTEQLEELVRKAIATIKVPTIADALPSITEKLEAMGAQWQLAFEKDSRPWILKLIESAFQAKEIPAPSTEQLEELVRRNMPTITLPTVADFLPHVLEKVEAMGTQWQLAFEKSAQPWLLKFIDSIPKPANGKNGTNGRDAFQVDTFEARILEDGRTVVIELGVGEAKVSKKIVLPSVIYRGYYKDGARYEPGDMVTFGGSGFIANSKTSSKPETDDTWRLAVKRGRDGLDGKKGERGAQGEKGETKVEFINPDTLGTR